MDTEKQQAMEQRLQQFVDNINQNHADTMCGLVKPEVRGCDWQEQSVTLAYPAQYWEQNPLGRMQGGVVATLLDFTVGCLAVCLSKDMPVTVSMQVSYLRPAPVDGTVVVKAVATKAGRTLVHAFAQCWDEQAPDKSVASGNFVYMV